MYIGKSPQTGAYSILDSLTASATASYTMQLNSVNYIPESAQHLIVSLNGSIQKPNSSFTVSGSTLTFSEALTSSDSIDFIYALGNVLDIGVPSDSTISTAKIIDSAVTNSKLANSSITLNGSAVSLGGSATVGGDNTPMFRARLSANVNSTQQVNTKVTFNVEDYDTDSAFDTSNGRFTIPSGKSGKYAIYGGLIIRDYQHDSGHSWALSIIYKNGSAVMTSGWQFQGNYGSKTFKQVYSVFDCSVGDYFELYYYTVTSDSGNGEVLADSNGTYFGGHKLISWV